MAGFEQAMNEQRERARAAGKFEAKGLMPADLASQLQPTVFLGYDALAFEEAKVVGIVRGGKQLEQLAEGEEGLVILDRTPFYAESGGQVGDTGVLVAPDGRFDVVDTLKMGGAFFGHVGRWQGSRAAASWRHGATRRSTRRGASRPCSIIRPRICCTLRCARCWASTSPRRARWSRRSGCASTSPTSSR